jgi:gamma-D-glutamyl-L-lysine dipeptidyl-peptidase
MPFAVCRLSLVPVRRHADLVSEITTQVLFGEGVEILEEGRLFCRARMLRDGYEGWIDRRQFTRWTEGLPERPRLFTDEHCGELTGAEYRMALPLGTPLPGFSEGQVHLAGETWGWKGRVREIPAGPVDREGLTAFARRYLHSPYLWGGRTVVGIDCSGFTQSVYAAFGVQLLRDARMQITGGTEIPAAEAAPGDLVFFASPALGVHHVGLVMPQGEVIHASSMVRLDDLSPEGIRHKETGELTHAVHSFRRVTG